MGTYYGVRLRVSRVFDALAWRQASKLASEERISDEEWFYLVHSVTLESKGTHWGFDALSERVQEFKIEHLVNQKQIKGGHIRFFALPPDAAKGTLWCFPHEIRQGATHHRCAVSPHSSDEEVRLLFATFVDRELKDEHRKIKLQVSAVPTSAYRWKMQNPGDASRVTKMDIVIPRGPTVPMEVQSGFLFHELRPQNKSNANGVRVNSKSKQQSTRSLLKNGGLIVSVINNSQNANNGGVNNSGSGYAAGGAGAINTGEGAALGGSFVIELKAMPATKDIQNAAQSVRKSLESVSVDPSDTIEIEEAVNGIERFALLANHQDKSILERVEIKLKTLESIAKKGKILASVLTPILTLFGVTTP